MTLCCSLPYLISRYTDTYFLWLIIVAIPLALDISGRFQVSSGPSIHIILDALLSQYSYSFSSYFAGRGGLQLFSRWSLDRGCLDSWYTCWSVRVDWSVGWPQRKAKCLWNWAGTLILGCLKILFYYCYLTNLFCRVT